MTSQIDVYESVVGAMEGIVARMLPVSHAPNAVFTEGHLNDGLLLGGVFSSSSSGRADSARNAHNRIIGRRLAEAEAAMPCGEWQRKHLAKIRPGTALAAFGEELDANLDLLRGRGLLPDRLDVAIDMHLIPRYDKEHGAELHRSKWKNGTQWFERYFTIQSVTPGVRLVLGALPMPALEDNADYLRKLVTICRGHGIGIGVLMADREFFDTSVMRILTDENIDYIIRAGTPQQSWRRSTGLQPACAGPGRRSPYRTEATASGTLESLQCAGGARTAAGTMTIRTCPHTSATSCLQRTTPTSTSRSTPGAGASRPDTG